MLYAHVLAYHTGRNRNQSNLTEAAAKRAMKSMAYKPVLANFCEIDGVRDFTSHDMEIDEDGECTYIEKQVGCFTADAPYMEKDPKHEDRMNIYAKVAIPREYTDAADIIERKNGTKCSVELAVNELSYDVKNKELRLEDVEIMGLTLLGVDPETGEEVREGMEGAHVQIEDFSVENNSLTFNSKIINEIAEAVANRLGDAKTAERRNNVVDFEENKKVEATEEEVTPEVVEEFDGDPEPGSEEPSEPTDAEVAAGVAALIEALPSDVTVSDADTIAAARTAYDALTDAQKELISAEVLAVLTGAEASLGEAQAAAANQTAASAVDALIEALSENITLDDADAVSAASQAYESLTPAQKALVKSANVTSLTAAVETVAVALSSDDQPKKRRQNNELSYTVTIDDVSRTYSVSLVDKLNALSTLVNDTYGEADDTFYDIDAYDEEKYVIMHDYWRNKHYRQSYSVKKDVYSLKGDRVEVFARYLTSDEIAKLDHMKADYAATSEKLAKYEAEPEKMQILNSEEYAQVAESTEFTELKTVEKHFDMSVDEVRKAADDLLLAFAKSNKLDFSKQPEKKTVGLKKFSDTKNKRPSRYGSLFKK